MRKNHVVSKYFLMRNVKIGVILSALMLVVAIYGCRDKCDDMRDRALVAEESRININILDSITLKPIIADNNARYNKEEVKLCDVNNILLNIQFKPIEPEQSVSKSYRIMFLIFQEEGRMGSGEITKRVFLDLGTDRDTIDYTFKKQERDCNGSDLKYIKIYYNNEVVGEFADNTSFELNISK